MPDLEGSSWQEITVGLNSSGGGKNGGTVGLFESGGGSCHISSGSNLGTSSREAGRDGGSNGSSPAGLNGRNRGNGSDDLVGIEVDGVASSAEGIGIGGVEGSGGGGNVGSVTDRDYLTVDASTDSGSDRTGPFEGGGGRDGVGMVWWKVGRVEGRGVVEGGGCGGGVVGSVSGSCCGYRVVRSGSCCGSLGVIQLHEASSLRHYFRGVLKKRRGQGAAHHTQENQRLHDD